jgi:prophage maintenance system killer protein
VARREETLRGETPVINGGRGEIVIYQPGAGEGGGRLEVRLEKESLWLSLNQIAAVFERDKSVISRHLRNVFREGELDRGSTVAFFATVQDEGGHAVERQVEYFNLDAILSVGYRVNSKRGTQFRIWATQVLRDHLVRGYSVNEKRLTELRQSLKLVEQVLEHYDVTTDQARVLLRVVTDYASALDLLDDYDHQRVSLADVRPAEARGIGYDEAMTVIGELRRKFGGLDLFGREKDQSLRGSLGAVMQAFDGKDVYPSLEEKAAHLLYFLVKNHSFVDGNKRIGASLFLWFMEKNGILYRADGSRHMADNALVAITLMIAESNPKQKDILTKVVVNLIKDRK